MTMKKICCLAGLLCLASTMAYGQTLSLDSCRALAIANNKDLLISREKINAARYEKKAASTNYLPKITAAGGYMRTGKEISLLSDAQQAVLGSMGTEAGGLLQNGLQGILAQHPELMQNTDLMTFVQALAGIDIATPLNQVGTAIVDAFRTDTRNMYAGVLTLTQPLYMGGKIRAYNKITRYAEELARQQHISGLQEVILSTDQAYWQVVSLAHKKKLAESYVELLQRLGDDLTQMMIEGVATKADDLTVRVKLNEAEMTLTKVSDGLSLSRMLLCQICGLELDTPILLEDESSDTLGPHPAISGEIDIESTFALRPEVRSLELGANIYDQKVRVARADFLPSLSLMGGYMATSPSVYNSFEKKFRGTWNVGVVLSVPIFHWGEGIYKVKAAKAESRIARHQLADAKEKIELQVNQAVFRMNEAAKKLAMADKNLEKADENLRYATLGFEEGVIPTSNVLEAHTAWLSAHSERIDAQIDVKLTELYFRKATGRLEVSERQ